MADQELSARVTFVYEHTRQHSTLVPGTLWQPFTATNWLERLADEISPGDLVTGWTSPIVDPTHHGHADTGEGPIHLIRFSPVIIAENAANLPLSPKPLGPKPYIHAHGRPDGLATDEDVLRSVWYLDNYVRWIEQVIDYEVLLLDAQPFTPADERRRQAEDQLYHVHPVAPTLMSMIEMAALDKAAPEGTHEDHG